MRCLIEARTAGLGDLPHVLAFYDGYLDVAEEHSVSRYRIWAVARSGHEG